MRHLLLVCAAGFAYAQGTTPKPSAADYPVHGENVGAEYMVHSFGAGEQMSIAADYLVVEVALFPAKDASVTVDPSRFFLRVNGKKSLLSPQPPSIVATSLTHPEWQAQRPGATADIGAGGVNAGLGYPKQGAPFPGAPQPRLPNPPRAPDSGPPGGIERAVPLKPVDVLTRTTLPEGLHRKPVSGFLFFPYTGRTDSIKSLELYWEGMALKLR